MTFEKYESLKMQFFTFESHNFFQILKLSSRFSPAFQEAISILKQFFLLLSAYAGTGV